MDDNAEKLQEQAIAAALAANWDQALALNQQLLTVDPNNVDALNRIARAYFELGNYSDSKKHYQMSLKADPYNQIAAKFIKRIEAFAKRGSAANNIKKGPAKPNGHLSSLDLFIEEPGKTKVVSLLKVAEPQRLSMLSPGEEVQLMPKSRGISVCDLNDDYLGVVPDDVSFQLLRLIRGGNKYRAFIKTIKTNGLSILIRESYRSARFKNQPSFLDSANAVAYSSDHITLLDDSTEPVADEEVEEDNSI